MSKRTATVFSAVLITAACGALGYVVLGTGAEQRKSQLRLEDIPFDGERAFKYLQEVCKIGPRPSGSPGMQAQQKLLAEHFRSLGGQVRFQNFRVRHPIDGSPVVMSNLIVEWHPQATNRILLCAHYDTRPYPDRDPRNPRGTFIGANDGASGTALLMEMAHEMADLHGSVGVDFVLFDGEELVFDEGDKYFWGSEYFATVYASGNHNARYRSAVLLDMVGDADLQLYYERNSYSWRDSRPLVESIWSTAARLGVQEFVARRGPKVNDDHVPLHNIGKIPACDIIDFDYPHWHTEADTPDKCSALSLAKVGWVVREWLKSEIKR